MVDQARGVRRGIVGMMRKEHVMSESNDSWRAELADMRRRIDELERKLQAEAPKIETLEEQARALIERYGLSGFLGSIGRMLTTAVNLGTEQWTRKMELLTKYRASVMYEAHAATKSFLFCIHDYRTNDTVTNYGYPTWEQAFNVAVAECERREEKK